MPERNHLTAKTRCFWASTPQMITYHDEEWGVPVHDDRKLFEMLLLEGFQAGLSWITILRKRENFRAAFHSFEPDTIAGFKKRDLDRLALDAAAPEAAGAPDAPAPAGAVAAGAGFGAGIGRLEPRVCR